MFSSLIFIEQKTVFCTDTVDHIDNLVYIHYILSFIFQNGTCYTTEECEDKSGTADGTCAEGYGVCCICKIS